MQNPPHISLLPCGKKMVAFVPRSAAVRCGSGSRSLTAVISRASERSSTLQLLHGLYVAENLDHGLKRRIK
jgi:hypothetical protein